MAIPKFEADLNIISKLVDEPNDEGGMSAQALKEEFDRAGLLVKEYINEILVPQANIDIDNAAKGIGGSDGMDGSTIVDGTVTASKLAANSVTAEKIAEDAVTADKIAPKAVSEEAFADASIPTRAYKQGSVGSAALAQNSVTADKIAEGAVTGAKIASGAVTTDKVANASVTRAKLANDALYSPINALRTDSFDYSPVATDLGKTLVTFNNTGEYKINITEAVSAEFPVGAEIAVLFAWGVSAKIVFSGTNARAMILGNSATAADVTLAIPERYGMAALKLINYQNGVYYWLVTGNVEVVS